MVDWDMNADNGIGLYRAHLTMQADIDGKTDMSPLPPSLPLSLPLY